MMEQQIPTTLSTDSMDFKRLVDAIRQVHEDLKIQASRAVNACLTLRNWLIGCYIQEYEQCGQDRAVYGECLIEELACQLKGRGVVRCDARELRRYRLFYAVYPQIREALPPELKAKMIPLANLGVSDSQIYSMSQVDGTTLVSKLSFTHLTELITLADSSGKCNTPTVE